MNRSWFIVLTLALGACSDPHGSATSRFWRERQMRVDPPELWSIEAVPQPDGWRPVRICTDGSLREGFSHPMPSMAGELCQRSSEPEAGPGRYAFRCTLAGRTYGVSSSVHGDLRRDFTATYSVTDLGGVFLGRGLDESELQQTRRYRRLGACPADWEIGEQTDRHGVRHRQAIVAERRLAGR